MKTIRLIRLPMLLFLLSATLVQAQQAEYEQHLALRSSEGFRAALKTALLNLHENPLDGTAWGVTALVNAYGADYMDMHPESARAEGARALEAALLYEPAGPFTHAAFGRIRMRSDPEGAERHAQQCVDDWPEFRECHDLLGDILRQSGRLDAAEIVYQSALSRWPDDGELWVSFALLLQESGKVGESMTALRDLVAGQPEFARGHWQLATLLYETGGDLAAARRRAERALALDPLIRNSGLLLRLLDVAEANARQADQAQ